MNIFTPIGSAHINWGLRLRTFSYFPSKLLHNQIIITIFAPSITRERAVWNTTPSSHWSCTAKPSCTSPPVHSRFGHMLEFFSFLRGLTHMKSDYNTLVCVLLVVWEKLFLLHFVVSRFFRIFAMNAKILSLVVKNIEVNFIFLTRLFVSLQWTRRYAGSSSCFALLLHIFVLLLHIFVLLLHRLRRICSYRI